MPADGGYSLRGARAEIDVIAPDRTAARRHVELLTGTADTPMCFRLIHDSNKGAPARDLYGTVDEVWPEIEATQRDGYGAFLVVNEGGQTDAEINSIRAVFIDADNVAQPSADNGEPDFLVTRDATHWHAYWRVTDLPVEGFAMAQKRLAAHCGTDPAVSNPSRVMRLAGTLHQKDRACPRLMRLVDNVADPALLSRPAADVLHWLPELPPKPDRTTPSAAIGKPVTPEQVRGMLSYIDPTFSGGDGVWVGISKAIRHGQIPVTEDYDGEDLVDDWCSGELWRERTGDCGFTVTTYHDRDELMARIGDPPRQTGERMIGLGTIIKLAQDNGYTGGIEAPVSTAETFKDALDKIDLTEPQPADRPIPSAGVLAHKFALLDEAEQDAEQDIDPLVGQGFLPDGGSAVIYAPFGQYKSFIGAELALAVASGKPAFGTLKVYRSGPVVYLFGEGHRGFTKRRRVAWRIAREIKSRLPIYTVKGVPLASDRAEMDACIRAIKARLGGVRPALVIIDTVARSMLGLSENDTSDATRYVAMTDEMAEALQCLVLSIAHAGKDESREMRGASAFMGNFENVFKVKADKKARVARIGDGKQKEEDDGDDGAIFIQGRVIPLPPGRFGQERSSLVFDAISKDEYQQAISGCAGEAQGQGERRYVETALRGMGCIGPENATTTAILATELVRRDMGEAFNANEAEQQARIVEQIVWLKNRSTPKTDKRKKVLAGLYHPRTQGQKVVKEWYVPTDCPASQAEE